MRGEHTLCSTLLWCQPGQLRTCSTSANIPESLSWKDSSAFHLYTSIWIWSFWIPDLSFDSIFGLPLRSYPHPHPPPPPPPPVFPSLSNSMIYGGASHRKRLSWIPRHLGDALTLPWRPLMSEFEDWHAEDFNLIWDSCQKYIPLRVGWKGCVVH